MNNFKTRGLRYYLENYLSREQLDNEFKIQMEAVGESTCNSILGKIVPDCKFKITEKQYENGKDSDDLLTHLYTHVNRRERNDDFEVNDVEFWEYMNDVNAFVKPLCTTFTKSRPYRQISEYNVSEYNWQKWKQEFGTHYEKVKNHKRDN